MWLLYMFLGAIGMMCSLALVGGVKDAWKVIQLRKQNKSLTDRIDRLKNQCKLYEDVLHDLSEKNANHLDTIEYQRQELESRNKIIDKYKLGCPNPKKDCANYSYCLELINEVASLEEKIEVKDRALEAKIPEMKITGKSMYADMYEVGA